MLNDDLSSRLTEVFQRVFNNKALRLSRETTAKDVDGWDSLNHVNLIVAVEREFKLRFTTREIAGLQNVGQLIDVIARKAAVRT